MSEFKNIDKIQQQSATKINKICKDKNYTIDNAIEIFKNSLIIVKGLPTCPDMAIFLNNVFRKKIKKNPKKAQEIIKLFFDLGCEQIKNQKNYLKQSKKASSLFQKKLKHLEKKKKTSIHKPKVNQMLQNQYKRTKLFLKQLKEADQLKHTLIYSPFNRKIDTIKQKLLKIGIKLPQGTQKNKGMFDAGLFKSSFKYTAKYNSFCRSKFRTKLLKITKKYKNKLDAATRKGLSKRLILLQTLLNKHLYSPPINVTKKKKKQTKRRRTKRKN